jgi:hypothetical protein
MLPLNLYARVRFCLRVWHMRPRVRRAPGFPCALCFRGGDFCQNSDAARREIAELHLLILPFATIGVIL